jgi:hypothetical protein
MVKDIIAYALLTGYNLCDSRRLAIWLILFCWTGFATPSVTFATKTLLLLFLLLDGVF